MRNFRALDGNEGKALWSAYRDLCSQSRATQECLALDLLKQNATSQFGNIYDFAHISSSAMFRRVVPISKWSSIAPFIDELLRSGGDVLTANDPVLRFNLTSGTSGSPKLVPLTRLGQIANAITLKLRILLAARDHPEAMKGKLLPFVHESAYRQTSLGIPYGSPASASVTNVPVEMAKRFAFPPAILAIKQNDAKKYAMVRFSLAHDVTMAAGNNPFAFVKLFDFAKKHRAELIEDIRSGTLTPPSALVDDERNALSGLLHPDEARARLFETMTEETFVPRGFWPELKLFFCWKTGVMGRSVPELLSYCAEGARVREFGYGASEGLFSIPLGDETSEGVLAVHGIFYEFLPEHEALTPNARTLLAHEVQPGKRYQMVLTNCSGLYRYALEDIVEVTGFLGEAPIIVFIRRAGEVVNIVGEKIASSHVVAAFEKAHAEGTIGIRHFQWIANKDELRYELCVEPMSEVDDDAPFQTLLGRFDAALCALVRPYEVFRGEGLLLAPTVRVMKRGWLASSLLTSEKNEEGERKPRVVGEVQSCPSWTKKILHKEWV